MKKQDWGDFRIDVHNNDVHDAESISEMHGRRLFRLSLKNNSHYNVFSEALSILI